MRRSIVGLSFVNALRAADVGLGRDALAAEDVLGAQRVEAAAEVGVALAGLVAAVDDVDARADDQVLRVLGVARVVGQLEGGTHGDAAASDLAYFTLGWNWSAIDRLPAGQQLGAAPMNDNILNNLPKRTDDGWFLAVSFKFMSPGEGFFKGKVVPQLENVEAEKTE